MIIETLKEYSLFNMQDKEIRAIASRLLQRNVHEDTFRRIKKQAQKQNMIASEWIDIFCKSQVIDYYWQRIKEVELTQKYLIQRYLKEVEKIKTGEDDPNVLSKLATNIRENNKLLAELGMAPPILSRLQEIIPQNVTDMNKLALENTITENDDDPRERIESGIYLFKDPKPVTTDLDIDDSLQAQRVF